MPNACSLRVKAVRWPSMPTGLDVVREALKVFAIPGVHYGSYDCPHRCRPDQYPHCVDCSGLTSYVLNTLGLNEGCTGSFEQSIECHRAGTGMSIDDAFRTPGALLFQGINEGQGGVPGRDPGHVGISMGDNLHSLEARGHWSGVGVFYARSLIWQYAAMPVGVSRQPIPQPLPPGPQPPPMPVPNLATEETNVTMVALPTTKSTPPGQVPTAIPVRTFNFVLLESGARLIGDVAVDKTGKDLSRHWWAPTLADAPLAVRTGWQIQDITDLRQYPEHHENAIVVTYSNPDGSRAGTYKAQIAS